MAVEPYIDLKEKNDGIGSIKIAPEVVEIILGIAASSVDGVSRMRGNLSSNINEWLGRSSHSKGVSLVQKDGNLIADVYVYVKYGVSIPKIAMQLQKELKQQLLNMTDLNLDEINVHIVGIVTPKPSSGIDPNNLFSEDNGKLK